MKGIASALQRGASKDTEENKNATIVDANTMGNDIEIIRMQVEGMSGAGKSHFLLSIVKHAIEVMGIPPEKTLFCLIDCDKKGIAPLFFSKVIPVEYQKRIQYAKCDNIWQVYDAFQKFDKQLREWREKTGFDGWLFVENMGTIWYMCQRDYVESVYHIPYTKLLLDRQEEASSKGKKTLPALDQMLDYRNINPLHNELANSMANGEYNLCWTTTTKTRQFQEGDNDVQKVVGAGQKDNDYRVDFILRLYNTKGTFFSDSRKLRSVDKNFNMLKNPTFTNFVNKWYEMLKRNSKKRGLKTPKIKWNTKQTIDEEEKSTEEEKVEEEKDEEDEDEKDEDLVIEI